MKYLFTSLILAFSFSLPAQTLMSDSSWLVSNKYFPGWEQSTYATFFWDMSVSPSPGSGSYVCESHNSTGKAISNMWGKGGWDTVYFRRSFRVNDPDRVTSALLTTSTDDIFTVYVNGTRIYDGNAQTANFIADMDMKPYLHGGDNMVAIRAINTNKADSSYRVCFELDVKYCLGRQFLGDDRLLCDGEELLLDANVPEGVYSWQDNSTGPSYVVRVPGIYYVSVTNSCGTMRDTIQVDYRDCKCPFYIPEAFSPNDDSLNEVFMPSLCNLSKFNLQIFNRWGEKVFETDDMERGWDGTSEGHDCVADKYVYVLKAKGIDRKNYNRTGCVVLYR